MIFQEKHGREMDQLTKEEWGREASVSSNRINVLLRVRVGREEEGVNSLRPELAAVAQTLQATPPGINLLYLCDSETTLNKVSR